MTRTRQKRSSFLVRIWWEQTHPGADDRAVWRGWVQHTHSGEAGYVQDVEELLDFIERWTGALAIDNSESERETLR